MKNLSANSTPQEHNQVNNLCVHLDEYQNDIDIEKVKFLKDTWNYTNKSQKNMDNYKKN